MSVHRLSSVLILAGLIGLPVASLAQVTPTSVTLSWTTPGDDSVSGTASQFDLRYSTSSITASNFGSATRWSGMPTPAGPGTRQTVTVTGLTPNTRYYFAIKTGDEVPNWSGISNVINATTSVAPDQTRPAPLAVTVSASTDSSATLRWTAVGDDSLTGTATTYEVRYSTSTITAANWNSATQVSGEPGPASPGTTQTYTVQGLSRQVTYYFAVRVSDEAGNMSALSNVPSITTPDTMAPAAIRDLSSSFVWFSWHSTAAVRPARVSTFRP